MTNKPHSYKKHDFQEKYLELKSKEGREEAIKWFLFNVELIEEALEIAAEFAPQMFKEVP